MNRAHSAVVLSLVASLLAGCVADAPDEGESESASALGGGTGLSADYFSDTTFGTLVLHRIDAKVDFQWAKGAPAAGVPADDFSVRWTGQVEAPATGTFTFTTTSDDGVRLWVNGTKLVDNWTQHAATQNSGTIALTKGQRYDIKLEYYEGTGGATARLAYTPPGGASQIIPTAQLFPTAAPPPATGITIVGNQLRRNGQAWTPHGFSMIGALTCGSARTAFSRWNQNEVNVAKSWGADAFRFQVSQPYLDPQDAKHDATYIARLQSMVALAKQNGFAVILSMQDQSLACGDATPLPTAATTRAWAALGPVFKNDAEVIYELYNEPDNRADAAGWDAWKNGGGGNVGHQKLLDDLRALGAKNVILADGAQKAEVLTGVPLLNDPLGKTGYAVHPYYMAAINGDPQAWDKRFGSLAATHVVVATEWDAQSSNNCRPDDATLAPKLMTYLEGKHIGLFGWALDLPGTLIQDWNYTPTNYVNYTCGTSTGGAGALIKSRWAK